MKSVDEIISNIGASASVKLSLVFLLSLSSFVAVWLAKSTLYTTIDIGQYLVFHNITEFFSIMVSLSIFGIGWYSYEQSKNKHALFLGCAFLAIGLLDFMHTLSYHGMPDFITPNPVNKPTQFWIAARLFSAIAFLVSAYIYPDAPNRWITKRSLLTAAFAISGLVFIGVIYYSSYLPAAFIDGVGLTPFKIYSEYVINALLAMALIAYWKRYSTTGNNVHILFMAALIISIFSELAFTLYKSAYDTYNMLGHVYKIIAFFLIYKGLFTLSVEYPYMKLAESTTELRLLKEEAERANMAKTNFLQTMSHELRTPLNAILGFSEMLKQRTFGELNEKQERFIDNIITGSNNLHKIISQILDIVKMEEGTLELHIEKILVPETVDEVIGVIKEKAAKKNVLIEKNLDPELEYIEADNQKFKQVFINLLDNAVKFSKREGGTVTINAKKEGDMAKFSVSDRGIGIKEEDLEKIFQKFTQLDSGTSRKYGGVGIGLAITKQLVELHGGKIQAESRHGKGSTFIFILPIQSKQKDQGTGSA